MSQLSACRIWLCWSVGFLECMCAFMNAKVHDCQSICARAYVCVCVCVLCTGSAPFIFYQCSRLFKWVRETITTYLLLHLHLHLLISYLFALLFCCMRHPHLISFFLFALAIFKSQNWNSEWRRWKRDRMRHTQTYQSALGIALVLMACVYVYYMLHHFNSNTGFLFDYAVVRVCTRRFFFCMINLTIRPHFQNSLNLSDFFSSCHNALFIQPLLPHRLCLFDEQRHKRWDTADLKIVCSQHGSVADVHRQFYDVELWVWICMWMCV